MRYGKYIQETNLIGNLSFLNLFYFIGYAWIKNQLILPEGNYFVFLLILNIAWGFSSFFTNVNKSKRNRRIDQVIVRYLRGFSLYLLLIFALISMHGQRVSNEFVFQSYVLTIIGVSFFQLFFTFFMKYWRRTGHNYKNVVIAGYGAISEELRDYFEENPHNALHFQGYFDDQSSSAKGKVEDLFSFCESNQVDEIYCCPTYLEPNQIKKIIPFAEDRFIKIKVIPDFRGYKLQTFETDFYDHIPVLRIRPIPLDENWNRFMKRAFDIAFSLLVMIGLFSWLFPIIALIIKWESKGPVFFKQERSGINNNPFLCYKFRSMKVNSNSDKKQATKNDNRITKFGAFIRKSSIDELPQFINVLRGEMSVVGPRPHMLKHTEEYSKLVDQFMYRHSVKPGITGLAQAKGYRGETETVQAMKNRVTMDKFYVSNWTFWFDIKIILLTIDSMIRKNDNAY